MKGAVACPQPRAADVGAEILAKGGTAFDAAVAAAFSQMVNDPFMCGIGGKSLFAQEAFLQTGQQIIDGIDKRPDLLRDGFQVDGLEIV